jgi:membrane protease subunit (stomatin/prohibitin family)
MPFMRRRPLLRAAAVGGVAYMGAKAGTNRAMQNQAAQQAPAEPAPAPAPAPAAAAAPPAGDDTISRLTQLAQLHESGALTDEEFAAAKAQVLA